MPHIKAIEHRQNLQARLKELERQVEVTRMLVACSISCRNSLDRAHDVLESAHDHITEIQNDVLELKLVTQLGSEAQDEMPF